MEIKENDNILKPVNSGNEASVSITMHVAHKYNSFVLFNVNVQKNNY